MRIGIIGFDTSHAHVFPERIRELGKSNARYKDLEFEAGWPGDPATAVHPEALEGFQKKIDDLGIKVVKDLDELMEQCDGFMVESVNGGTHLELAKRILPAKKPTFIDKPFANTIEDAKAMADLIDTYGTPCWSSSALRYEPNMRAAIDKAGIELREADVYGPAPYFEKGRGIVYYGIHTAEMIFAIMGTGVKSVHTTWQENREVIVGRWSDGRVATLRAQREPRHGFGGMVHGSEGSVPFEATGDFYGTLTEHISEFFVAGKAPVVVDETLEVIAFLEGAVRSREAAGKEIFVSSFM